MQLFPEQDPDRETSTYETSRPTGFTENWSNALGLAMTEDLPLISPLIPSSTQSQRDKKLLGYMKDGTIPKPIADFYMGDQDGLAEYAKDNLGISDIPSRREYQEAKDLEYKQGREMSAQTFSQQSWAGKLGEIAGTGHAMAIDPYYAVSALTGYGAASTMGQAFLRVGAVEALVEVGAQAPKMAWKDEIGADYSGADAFAEVVFAGVGAGALAALGKGVGKAYGKVFTKADLTVGQAVDVVERLVKENPEIEPILNTLRHADPEDNLIKVMEADEAVDIRMAEQGPVATADVKGDLDMKASDFDVMEEEAFLKRQPVKEEGVPRGTPLDVTPGKRVSLTEKPSGETLARFEEEASRAQRSAKSATKKYKKAESEAKAAERSPHIGEDSVIGRKAKQAAELARSKAEDRKLRMDEAVAAEVKATALATETATAAKVTPKEEGVPRGTPTPDTRHALVKEADDLVVDYDNKIKLMEECF